MEKNQKTSIMASLDQQIKLSEVIRMLLSKWYWILGAGFLGFLMVFCCTKFLMTPQYESYITMYVYNNPELNASAGVINNNDLQAAESLADTYAVILKSNVVLDVVVEDVNTNKGGDMLTREQMKDMIDITTVDGMQILEVSVTTDDANLSYLIADAFARISPEQILKITKAGGAEVVDQAEISNNPVAPRVLFDSILGCAVGVLLAVIYFVIRMISDTTICTAEDVENVIDVPLLGSVPKLTGVESGTKVLGIKIGGVIEHGGQKSVKNKEEHAAGKSAK